VAAGKGVLTIAPRAAEIASGQAHEDARQPREGRLALDGFVDFDDVHESAISDKQQRASIFCFYAYRLLHIADYSEYLAVVVSVSQIVTSFTLTRPEVELLRVTLVSSKKNFARFSADGFSVVKGATSLIMR